MKCLSHSLDTPIVDVVESCQSSSSCQELEAHRPDTELVEEALPSIHFPMRYDNEIIAKMTYV